MISGVPTTNYQLRRSSHLHLGVPTTSTSSPPCTYCPVEDHMEPQNHWVGIQKMVFHRINSEVLYVTLRIFADLCGKTLPQKDGPFFCVSTIARCFLQRQVTSKTLGQNTRSCASCRMPGPCGFGGVGYGVGGDMKPCVGAACKGWI